MNKTVNEVFYKIAAEVYEGNLSKSEGIDKLVNEHGINRNSAAMVIRQIFPKLLKGEKFTRTLSIQTFECFLNNIQRDYGKERLKLSLDGLKKHIDYIKDKGDSKIGLSKIYQKYLAELELNSNVHEFNEKEQEELMKYFVSENKKDLIDKLNRSVNTNVEVVSINGKCYKRNNKVVALIKILRNFKCQLCGTSITKKDGSKYIEAAHIIPKHKKGNETPDNILVLCPNHHKEFDLGDRVIEKHDTELIKFTLNNKKYKIDLSIS